MADTIAAITQARTVPDAVAAFTRGLALDRGHAGLYQAYVRRMLELGGFDLAVTPAQTLAALQPDNALALAVLATDAARHGDMRTALTDAVIAANHLDEPFVQHVLAEVLAWYDAAGDHALVPAAIASSLEALRPRVQDRPIFAATYAQALRAYQDRAAAELQAARAAAAKPEEPVAPVVAQNPPAPTPPVPPTQIVNNYFPAPPMPSAPELVVVDTLPTPVYAPPAPLVIFVNEGERRPGHDDDHRPRPPYVESHGVPPDHRTDSDKSAGPGNPGGRGPQDGPGGRDRAGTSPVTTSNTSSIPSSLTSAPITSPTTPNSPNSASTTKSGH
jgi:hypothetical protein